MKETELRGNKIDRYKRHVCSVWIMPNKAPGLKKTLDAGHAMGAHGMA